jgi:hypothetical protein
MAGIPCDLLASDYTISYVPSGTFLARLNDNSPVGATTLLAVGDPVLSRNDHAQDAPLPPGGLLITFVADGGAAAGARLQAGDVLLKYGGVELTSPRQLEEAIAAGRREKSIPVTVWRSDATRPVVRDVASGELGAAFDRNPARLAIANRRKLRAAQASLRAGWDELPGSRIEVNSIGKLFGDGASLLTDSSASEQSLEQLRRDGRLAAYRYFHFATHGEVNGYRAFESTLILAQDALPEDAPLRGGEPFIDGQLSAREVLQYWKLNADLVTLSACKSAVGVMGGGEGQLGFAQAFLAAGTRAVCLSLWDVDDQATTLLMDRFYQNLLAKRPGIRQPMPKAAALEEAKQWLRSLTADQALKLTAEMTDGVVRGKNQPALPVANVPKVPDTATATTYRPYDHPKYWAAFILIGDPN